MQLAVSVIALKGKVFGRRGTHEPTLSGDRLTA